MLRFRLAASPQKIARWNDHSQAATAGLVFALLLGVGAAALASPDSAQAQAATAPPATATPTPAPTPDPSQKAAPAPQAPTIESPPAGSFIGSGSTTVSGSRAAGQEIQLLSPNGGDPLCIVAADDSTTWTCTRVLLPSGPTVSLRVVVTGDATLAAEQTVSVLAAPKVVGGPTGQAASNGVVRGTAYPDASVIAELGSGQRCTSTADGSGAWSCTFGGAGLASGPVEVTAAQQTSFSRPSSSNSSSPVTLTFDVDAPGAPVLASPVDSARVLLSGATYSGTGEDGAMVTVFAGPYSVCTVVVDGGAWRCTAGGVAAGSYRVRVVQQDPAGNMSAGSPAITVVYGEKPASTPSAGGMTALPVPPSEGGAAESPAPAPTPDSAQPTPPRASPRESGGFVALPPTGIDGGWNDPTQFTAAVLPPDPGFSWLNAALLAFGSLLLLAIPARLLSGTISRARAGRPLWRGTPISGRNHPRDDFERAPTVLVHRWLLVGAALLAAATLVMLSGPIGSRPAYLRLLAAVTIALLLVNAVGALVPRWWSLRVMGLGASVTFLPRYLLLVGVMALASRVFEVHPALLFGLLGSVTIAADVRPERRGQLAAVRAASLILLAVLGWLLLGLLPQAAGFANAFGAEIANSVVLAAIGSAAIVLVPLGSTSGRSILAWSPFVWAGLTILAFTIMFAVLSPAVTLWRGDGTATLLWVSAGVFAALSTGAWAWQRFVSPAVD